MTVNDVDCCYIIPDINKPEAINLLENSVWRLSVYIKNIFRFLAWHTKFEKCKALKKNINKELMLIAWYRRIWWNFYMTEDKKKETESIFTD